MQELKPKAGPKKKQYKGKLTSNYTPSNKIYLASQNEKYYYYKINKLLQYHLGLLIKAELVRKGWTVRAVLILLEEQGFKTSYEVLNAMINGSCYNLRLSYMYKVSYLLKIDLDPLKIPEAINYLRANGRSVKDF